MKKESTSDTTNIVSDFLTKKRAKSNDTTSLGKLAVSNSNYFDLGNKNIKKIDFDKSLSLSQLDAGYKKIIDLIEKDLDAIDSINELVLHSKLMTKISWFLNNLLLKSSVIKFNAATTIILSLIYAIYTLIKTDLYPNPLMFMSIGALSWLIGAIRSLFNKN